MVLRLDRSLEGRGIAGRGLSASSGLWRNCCSTCGSISDCLFVEIFGFVCSRSCAVTARARSLSESGKRSGSFSFPRLADEEPCRISLDEEGEKEGMDLRLAARSDLADPVRVIALGVSCASCGGRRDDVLLGNESELVDPDRRPEPIE